MKRYGLPVLAVLLILFVSACGGVEEEHYPSGELKRSGSRLKDGSKDGIWTSYYRNGHKLSSGRYENGKKEGTWTFWDMRGEKSDLKEYWQGKEVSGKIKTVESKPARSHSASAVAATMEEWKSGAPAKKLAVTMEEWKARKTGESAAGSH
ncbi:MAG: hypothetical protein IMF07_03860 [Proteobacteria bacterium]|nr:hypothetical protein [Pseudomonadota bacterium]